MFVNLSDLQKKDVVNLDDGKKIGRIIDAEVSYDGKINYFVVLNYSFWKFWRKNEEVHVSFSQIKKSLPGRASQIKKIGEDVILVEF